MTIARRTMCAIAVPFFTGCVTLQPVISLDPMVTLASVQRPAAAEQRYGAQRITEVRDSANYYRYEDSLIVATFEPVGDRVYFDILNKTNTPIQIGWTEAAFVDPKGQSQPVMHTGVKYTDCTSPKAPSVLTGHARVTDAVIPCGYLELIPPTTYSSGGWHSNNYLGAPKLVRLDVSESVAASLTQSLKGKTIKLLLPIKNQDFVSDYTFTFDIRGIVPGGLIPGDIAIVFNANAVRGCQSLGSVKAPDTRVPASRLKANAVLLTDAEYSRPEGQDRSGVAYKCPVRPKSQVP